MDEPRMLAGGLAVSAQGYGAMSLSDAYGPIDAEEAGAVVAAARDLGITLFDSANIYGDGWSEEMLGRAFRRPADRDRVVIATKFGIVRGGGPGHRGIRGDRDYVFEQVDASLRRLGTDHIDLLYQHRIDRELGVEETVGAMAELVAAGKVRHLGLSEATGSEVRRANAVHPIAAVQSEWSAFSRDIEENLLPDLAELGIPIVPYAPLSRGLLTGRIEPGGYEQPDIRAIFPRFGLESLPHNLRLVAELAEHAERLDATPGQLALAWLDARAAELGVTSIAIPGTRSPAHLAENIGALGLSLPPETKRLLDGFAERVSGPRNADPRWTSLGRP
ncbi:aldo/keto reductase, partial [Leucobacter soli]|uniref:Aldo-keto reductase IolS n=1 Tax=Leucobacter soli TaxID=2812850 RepID=A0A916JVD5_9MICO|nr:aldo/keto reductase [Leucobacter soli]CAG7606347.1 Aldo-keto reductase IolS [Leucobacter soli]